MIGTVPLIGAPKIIVPEAYGAPTFLTLTLTVKPTVQRGSYHTGTASSRSSMWPIAVAGMTAALSSSSSFSGQRSGHPAGVGRANLAARRHRQSQSRCGPSASRHPKKKPRPRLAQRRGFATWGAGCVAARGHILAQPAARE